MILIRRPWTRQPQVNASPSEWARSKGLIRLTNFGVNWSSAGALSTSGSPIRTPATYGLEYKFVAASSQYIDLGAMPSTALTVACIFNHTATAASFIWSTRTGSAADGFEILLNATATGYARARASPASNQTADYGGLNDGVARVHIVTRDGATMRHYVGGVQVGSVADTSLSHSQNLRIASRATTYLNAAVGDVAVFSGALSAQEVELIGTPRDFYARLFTPMRRLVPMSAASGLPTLTALTASNITTSGWRATLTAA